MSPVEALLDTDAFIALTRRDKLIKHRISGFWTGLSIISIGELYYGVRRSSKPEVNEGILNSLLDEFEIISPNLEIARLYGEIFAVLRRQGKPIPPNDIWIAATAMRTGIPLITRDKHFENIEELRILSW